MQPSARTSPTPPLPGRAAPFDPPDIQVMIFAPGGGRESLVVTYPEPISEVAIRRDFRRVAEGLRTALPRPVIDRRSPHGMTAVANVEAEFPGLVNWGAGVVHLDPILSALRRFRHFKVTCLFLEKFDLTWPVGEKRDGPIHWKAYPFKQAVTYDIWIDQSEGVPRSLPRVSQRGLSWFGIAGIALAAVLLTMAIFYLVYRMTHQRDADGPESEG